MNNKEKIRLLTKFIEGLIAKPGENHSLPTELRTEISIQANILQTTTIGGAVIYRRELEREERDKEITQIQKKQTKILDEQKIFTKILALATLLLGITAFLNFFGITYSIEKVITKVEFLYYIFLALAMMGITTLIIIFCLLINEAMKLFFNKK